MVRRISSIASDLECSLKDEEKRLMDELLRLAMLQNPELASQLSIVKSRQEMVKDVQRRNRIKQYLEWKRQQDEEHRSQRKISYDDRANKNALSGIRRRIDYKSLNRTGQLEMEWRLYYSKYSIPPPFNPVSLGFVKGIDTVKGDSISVA